MFICTTLISASGLPAILAAWPINPHSLHISWQKATGPVTVYRIHCFPCDSREADVIKEIKDKDQESALITGLKPNTEYRLGITSVSLVTESKLVLSDDKFKLRKLPSHSCVRSTGLDRIWVQHEIY